MSVIDRPEVEFDGASHTYKIEGEEVLGVSTIAKIGGVEDTWGIASAWGFRIGYEGAHALATEHEALQPFDVEIITKNGPGVVHVETQDDLRSAMKGRGLTPWSTRDRAAERGTWVHDVLEALAQDGDVPDINQFPDEVRGHVKSVLAWYIQYRPTFVATEVQVSSREHGFAGRYDIRCTIDARRLLPLFQGHESGAADRVRAIVAHEEYATLCLVDLKTSKGIYPTTHFPQLAGYELASVEMGFPPTDCQLVLNSHADGSPATLGASWATGEDFVAFLGALRAIRRIKAADPEARIKAQREEAIMAALPARSRELAETLPELHGLDGRAVGFLLGGLRKRGRVQQAGKGIWEKV